MIRIGKPSHYRMLATGLVLLLGACTGQFDTSDTQGNIALPLFMGSDGSGAADVAEGPDCVVITEPATDIQIEMLDALNAYRAEYGLEPLIYSKRLEQAISRHVQDLYNRQFFDHTNPDGKTPGDRAVDAGFCHVYVGENIAAGQVDVEAVMQAWKNSPGHNKNMLLADYVYVGMGYFVSPEGRKYWGQAFALDLP